MKKEVHAYQRNKDNVRKRKFIILTESAKIPGEVGDHDTPVKFGPNSVNLLLNYN